MTHENDSSLSSRSRDELRRLEKEILSGAYGAPGNRFLSTREVAEIRHVSLVTAQRILVSLREKRLIELVGKTYFLCHGRVRPDSPLGRLTARDTRILGLHVTNIDTPFFSALTKAAGRSAEAAGYRLLTAASGYQPDREREILNTFVDIGAAGVLTCPGIVSETAAMYDRYRLPHVFLGRKPAQAFGEAVLAQNTHASVRVAEHFLREGYPHFAYVGLEMESRQDPRLNGYLAGLSQAGYELPPAHILRVKAQSSDEISDELAAFARRLPKPCAVFCFHDLLGMSLLQACHQLKLSVPRTVAVAGFDNLPVSAMSTPSLTTVSYCIEDMAETAVRLLIAQIESGQEKDTSYYLEPSLIVRESSSAAPIVQFRSLHTRDMLYKVSE